MFFSTKVTVHTMPHCSYLTEHAIIIYAWVKPGRDIVLMVFSFLLIYAWVKPGRDIVLMVFSFLLLLLLLLLLFLLLKTFLCSPVTQKLK